MFRKTKMILMCDGEVVNTHGNSGSAYGWTNPLETLPPIGSTIEYMTFNQSHKENQGVLTKYLVKSHTFKTEEDFNRSYRNHECRIDLEVIE